MGSNSEILNLTEFIQSKYQIYKNENDGFSHNFNRDLQFIILWENGRHQEKAVIERIESEYKIIYCAEITWSQEHFLANLNRLYSRHIDDQTYNQYKLGQVGLGPFLCVVFEDENPTYGYVRSLSGDISIGNSKAVELKYQLRTMFKDNFVHGTSSLKEFFHDACLLFHYEKLMEIVRLQSWDGEIHHLKQDLAGTGGWNSFEDFLIVTNLSANWVFLRNYEYLPNNFWENDKDLDVLCEDLTKFASVTNAKQKGNSTNTFETIIEGKTVPIDIRYLGDQYYDLVWQYNMLSNRAYYKSIVPRLRDDDYFFSLLYHAKLQKPKVKEVYIPRLIKLAKDIGLQKFAKEDLLDDKKAASILNGYMKVNGYYFYKPIDPGVHLNKEVYQYIMRRKDGSIKKSSKKIRKRFVRALFRLVPRSVKRIVPIQLKVGIRRLLLKQS